MTPNSHEKLFLQKVEGICLESGESDRELRAAQDKNSSLKFYAVRVPVLRKILSSRLNMSQLDQAETLCLWSYVIGNSEYYEPIALGLLFYQKKENCYVEGLDKEVFYWSQRMENWGHCDLLGGVVANVGSISWPSVRAYYDEWSVSSNVWLNRLSIVGLVRYVGKSAVYLPFELAQVYIDRHLTSTNKYLTRAIGWVLREYLKSDPNGAPRDYIRDVWDGLPSSSKSKLRLFLILEK